MAASGWLLKGMSRNDRGAVNYKLVTGYRLVHTQLRGHAPALGQQLKLRFRPCDVGREFTHSTKAWHLKANPTSWKARGLRQRRTVQPNKQADLLGMPRPKLLQLWRVGIELSASGCQIVQVLDHLESRIIVSLAFGGDKCLHLPSFEAKIARPERLLDQATNTNIRRMRAGEANRLRARMNAKLDDLATAKDVTVSFSLIAGGRIAIGPAGSAKEIVDEPGALA